MNWWQALSSLAALLTAVAGATLGFIGLVRSGRAEEAKGKAELARERADAAGVGLEYLRAALAAQQETMLRQEGEIGALRGQLAACHERCRAQDVQIAELRRTR